MDFTNVHPSNQFYLRLINPYDPVMWDFSIFTTAPTPIPEVEYPDYDITDFLNTDAVEFQGYIEEGMTLHPLYKAFEKVATSLVNYEILGEDEGLWKHLVSMWIAHNLEMAMARMKNQADEISLTPEKHEDKKITYKCSEMEGSEFMVTKYGFTFWTIYEKFAKFRFWGVYTPRGLDNK